MKRITFSIAIIIFALFSACTNELDTIAAYEETTADIHESNADFTIPLEDALMELESALAAIDNQTTTNNGAQRVTRKKREIANIEVIYKNRFGRGSRQSGMNKAPALTGELLYVVNFADNQGCAVLAADNRIPDPVLAITESGNIAEEMFPIYEEGIGYDGNILENFSIYNKDEDDYYVAGVGHPLLWEDCYDYAIICTEEGGGDGPVGGSSVASTETGPWIDEEKISPKLITLWHQRAPFNDATPMSRWTLFHHYKRGPAGCIPIALAQIIAYHEYPYNLTVNGYHIDWQGLKEICNIYNYDKEKSGTDYNRMAVAQLVANIGAWCGVIYTPDFGFALPRKARDCMANYGYSNVVRHYGYDKSQITGMLRNDNPVFIASISGVANGHSWVIDGYIHQSRIIKKYNSAGIMLYSSTETRNLMHCNFGWRKGTCNGYYVSGIFNTKKGPEEIEDYENEFYKTGSNNFNWAYHIITYNHPN